MNLYITADSIGIQTGGGIVTRNECMALQELGPCEIWGREELDGDGLDPWKYDIKSFIKARHQWGIGSVREKTEELPKLAHVYAGTFSQTVDGLKFNNIPVTYTAAAHNVQVSRKAHEELGIPYNYPHITNPDDWKRYVRGYLEADVLICPSTHSASVMRGFGAKNRIVIIPHGCDLPESIAPLSKTLIFGYLGSVGPDKGLIDLLRAWKRLNYTDSLLVFGGRDTVSPWFQDLVIREGGGNIILLGWVNNVEFFYSQISCLIQPSRSEGFGIEVLEAAAYGRPVICSDGAGAVDLIPKPFTYQAGNVDQLISSIESFRKLDWTVIDPGWRKMAENYTWDIIREKYKTVWKELLNG